MKGGQFIVTLPKDLVIAFGWKKHDELIFSLDYKNRITIRKKDSPAFMRFKGISKKRIDRYFEESYDKKE